MDTEPCPKICFDQLMPGVKISVQFSLKPRTKVWGPKGGRASRDVRAGLGKLQGSMRSQKTKPERDKAILIDAFHVNEVQVHSG